ncbi:hypothetical protein SDJN03_13810, partial [Cucurbita argyrosperma subsp. sororia]
MMSAPRKKPIESAWQGIRYKSSKNTMTKNGDEDRAYLNCAEDSTIMQRFPKEAKAIARFAGNLKLTDNQEYPARGKRMQIR